MRRKGLFMLVLPAALLLSVFIQAGCAQTMPDQEAKPDSASPGATAPSGTAVASHAAAASRVFGFRLIAELEREGTGRNIFISPSNLAVALAMALAGAGGGTREAIAATLGFSGAEAGEADRALAELARTLRGPEPPGSGIELRAANALWSNQRFQLKTEYVRGLTDRFAARATALDFQDPAAPAAINDWVKEQTGGRIAEIAGQLDERTILFLASALYFKGRWQAPFERKRTQEASFHLAGGDKSVPMMARSGHLPHLRGEGFEAVSLAYGDGRLSMLIFLPDENSSLAAFLGRLNPQVWDGWMGELREERGELRLPRFKLEYVAELRPPLAALGMGVAFDPARADFSGIVSPWRGVCITKVMHKTFVEVNEEGTEAAAATGVQIGLTSVERPFRMVVDRPFFCAIRDNPSGALLFLGAIVEP